MDKRQIQKTDILYELTTLDACQKGKNLSDDALGNLTNRWFEIISKAFSFVSADVFHDAVVMFQASNPWFPTVHEIIDNIKTVWEIRRRNIKALPEPDIDVPTPEEMVEIRANLNKIFKRIGN